MFADEKAEECPVIFTDEDLAEEYRLQSELGLEEDSLRLVPLATASDLKRFLEGLPRPPYRYIAMNPVYRISKGLAKSIDEFTDEEWGEIRRITEEPD